MPGYGLLFMPKIAERNASALNMDPNEYKATLLEMLRTGPKVKKPFDWYFNLMRMIRQWKAGQLGAPTPTAGGGGGSAPFGTVAKEAISAYKSGKAG